MTEANCQVIFLLCLEDEREERRIGFVVENRQIVDEGFVVERRKSSVEFSLDFRQILQRLRDDRLGAVLDERQRRVVPEKLGGSLHVQFRCAVMPRDFVDAAPLGVTTLSKTTLSVTTLSITTLCMTARSIVGSFATLSINDT
jgi:hypothetical protein